MIPIEYKGITSNEFIAFFLEEMRVELYPRRKCLPSYEHHSEAAKEWAAIQKQLGESLFREYEDELTLAFIDYEKLNSEYFWIMGLVDAVNQRTQDMAVIETETDLSDPAGVEFHLHQACKHYLSRLEEKYRKKCGEHLQAWKEWDKSGRYFYYRHGVEFAQKLLGKMAPDRDSDGT